MPYIRQDVREQIDPYLNDLIKHLRKHTFFVGELNYVITKILHAAWEDNANYETGNALIGVLECAKQEFYRRKLVPYEDKKIEQNGDV